MNGLEILGVLIEILFLKRTFGFVHARINSPYDTGAGGQYLSGAIATALGDAVASLSSKKDFDKDGVNHKIETDGFPIQKFRL